MEKAIQFDELGLSQSTLKAIKDKGFVNPSEVQAITIPLFLKGEVNIMAQAQTGTGKTAAFGLPLIDLLEVKNNKTQALVLAPTRELAIQVADEIDSLKGTKELKVLPIYGGQAIDIQLRKLKKGAHIIVGTPGRVIDHLKRKSLKLDQITHLILDEADEMLNMGFIEDLEKIFEYTHPDKRVLLFSATMPAPIKKLAKKYMGDYESLKVKKEELTTDLTKQIYYEVKRADRLEVLTRILDTTDDFYGLIFCRTRSDVDQLVNSLHDKSYPVEGIHGDYSQSLREKALDKFKKKKVNILVATDVAARGIDVNNLSHVINYSLPQDIESYVHRIGRTGRAGKQGVAITFVTHQELRQLKAIEKVTKTTIEKAKVPDVASIIESKKKRIEENLKKILTEKVDKSYFNWAKSILENQHPTEVVASLLAYFFGESLNLDAYSEIKDTPKKSVDYEKMTRLFVALGKKDKYTPKKLVELICDRTIIKPNQIDDITMMDKFSFMNVPNNFKDEIIEAFKERGKKPLVTEAKKEESSRDGRKSARKDSKNSSDRSGKNRRKKRTRR